MTKTQGRPPAIALPAKSKSPRATVPQAIPLSFTQGLVAGCDRIVIYGTGGIGKSTLAAHLTGVVFFDVERSTNKMAVARDTPTSWAELRGKLATFAMNPPKGVRSVVIDSATIAEELAREHVVEFRKTDKNKAVDSIEGFGWGKGWQFVFEEFTGLLADLDRIAVQGINVCMIAHQVSTPAPMHEGQEYVRWEPHLYSGDKKGRGSIRERVFEWADHVLYIGYDRNVEDGKAESWGSRTVYTQELGHHIAKSREAQFAMTFDKSNPAAIWSALNIS